jgi:hypothetical protein
MILLDGDSAYLLIIKTTARLRQGLDLHIVQTF